MRRNPRSVSCGSLLTLLVLLSASTSFAQQSLAARSEPAHEPITEDLSYGATFTKEIAPALPEFTFKVIPEVKEPDGAGNPQSTIHDVQVFRGRSTEPLQSLTGCGWLGMETPYRNSDWFRIEDINFDGYDDIFVMTTWGATGNESGCVWLFNPKTGLFELSKDFSDLGSYVLDPATKTLTTHGHAGAGAIEAVRYDVENNHPIPIITVSQYFDPGKGEYHCVVRERREMARDLVTTRDFWAKTLEDACDPTDPFGEIGER
jgi:hypothetical protein